MFGFGGQYQRPPANHCFPMGCPPDSICAGVRGLREAYRCVVRVDQLLTLNS